MVTSSNKRGLEISTFEATSRVLKIIHVWASVDLFCNISYVFLDGQSILGQAFEVGFT